MDAIPGGSCYRSMCSAEGRFGRIASLMLIAGAAGWVELQREGAERTVVPKRDLLANLTETAVLDRRVP